MKNSAIFHATATPPTPLSDPQPLPDLLDGPAHSAGRRDDFDGRGSRSSSMNGNLVGSSNDGDSDDDEDGDGEIARLFSIGGLKQRRSSSESHQQQQQHRAGGRRGAGHGYPGAVRVLRKTVAACSVMFAFDFERQGKSGF